LPELALIEGNQQVATKPDESLSPSLFTFRSHFASIVLRRTCLGRALSDSNSSISYFYYSVFSAIWGICFSLKANPNVMKTSDSGTLLAQDAPAPSRYFQTMGIPY